MTAYAFDPESEAVSVVDADVTGVDFTVTDASCSSVDRFLDNNDGTVTDCRTGLLWLKDADCFGSQGFTEAGGSANMLNSGECGLSDGSNQHDWRLPTREELQGIGTDPPTAWEEGGKPPVTVTWTMPTAPFLNVQPYDYWTSTSSTYNSAYAWLVEINDGSGGFAEKIVDYNFWPVRSAD